MKPTVLRTSSPALRTLSTGADYASALQNHFKQKTTDYSHTEGDALPSTQELAALFSLEFDLQLVSSNPPSKLPTASLEYSFLAAPSLQRLL